MKTSEVVTIIIAIYGAVLSTIAIVRPFFSERVKVKVTVRKNRAIYDDPHYAGMTLTEIVAINVGRRPVTITTFGTMRLQPNTNLVVYDSQPRLPCELTEGKYVTSIWDQSTLDFSTIDYWSVWDSRGKEHRLREASLWKHWKSVRYMKRAWKQQKAKSASA